MKIYDVTTTDVPVESTTPTMSLGPAWAPPQQAIPVEPRPVQKAEPGLAIR
jgi:hypothetical protein